MKSILQKWQRQVSPFGLKTRSTLACRPEMGSEMKFCTHLEFHESAHVVCQKIRQEKETKGIWRMVDSSYFVFQNKKQAKVVILLAESTPSNHKISVELRSWHHN